MLTFLNYVILSVLIHTNVIVFKWKKKGIKHGTFENLSFINKSRNIAEREREKKLAAFNHFKNKYQQKSNSKI